ncbi:hypothetical protein H8356DRAFT_925545 [Neocallimastix lanati (nom. inval.)]|jgi:hypothetical protein|uniref:F-box domain-containing protein n=1 Tax=Neocallimastix californiae TaxID=1754190 RepID=A0A1Y2ERM2_9FUNG|nr:hypothetical protein H8356DRAFT_925545 [Neocallimastix sp. JGI-2020a]ORY74199.1 hypothetical protein LY90DRAFT_666333 [Neocallimastix californiae]|eukprot:ORY74199.1 hypothetical protein LY90DRAFT_666333 [Neocallimastix californiae]
MASLSVLYRRFKKLVFFLIIFYLVRSYYLRKKRGDSGDKRIEGAPERKRITDGREQRSETKSKLSEEDESDDESENEEEERKVKVKENNEKVAVSLEATETAVEEESKKDEKIEQDISFSMTENIKGPKDTNFVDIEKTEIVNEIIKDSEIEAKSREVPLVNNIEVIPTIADEIKFQLPEQDQKIVEEVTEEVPIVLELNENTVDSEVKSQQLQESLVNMVEDAIEEPEKLAAIVEDIIIPAKEVNKVIENPEKVEIIVDDSTASLEETSVVVGEISEELIEPPVEEVIEEVVEEVVEPQSNVAEEIAKPIVEEIVKAALETITEPTAAVASEEVIEEAKMVEPEVVETITESAKSEVNVLPAEEIVSEPKEEEKEKSSTDQKPQNIELLISEIEKVVNESESENSFIEDKEMEEEIVKPKPVNAADIVGHEEIIYEGDVDGDDDGEWIDEDDDGEWVDEDEEEEIEEEVVEEEEEKEKEKIDVKSEINKRQSLLLNTSIPNDILNSLMTPMSSTNSTRTFPLPTQAPAPANDKPKVLPDDILERIFREVDPQTLWVLRNTSIKTRNIVDNILKETFEQYDLSMDPLYFDVTSKDNLGLVLDTLDLPPFALAMLLHEVLKLDSQHIGYAFGQMFRVPSKIDIEYLTDVIVETLNILKTKKDVDIAAVMHGLQHYYCFNHSELDFYQLFDSIEMTPEEVARFIQNHYHFILSKSLPPLLQAMDVDEVFVAEMCKAYANGDMDAFARIISKVPVRYVRTSIHPADIQGDRVVVVNENGEDVIVVLNNDKEEGEEKEHHGRGKAPAGDEEEWVEEDDEDDDENREDTIIVENNQSFSLFIGRVLRFLNMSTKDVASFFKYLPEYCSYDEDEILEGLNWTEEQIDEMRRIMKEEHDKIARKMRELSKLIIQRRMSISSGIGSPLSGNPSISSPSNRSFY